VERLTIAPSLICTDLCNIQAQVQQLEAMGCSTLHIDIIDGRFSPDMPLGIDIVRQLRTRTGMTFDVHLMAKDNLPYIELLLAAGADRLCFHPEYEARPAILLRKIRAAGCMAGLAVSPEVPAVQIEPLLCLCDFLLIMRIDAGYAHLPGQQVYSHINDKIRVLQDAIRRQNHTIDLEADGRVGFADIVPLAKLGVTTFVSGTAGVFHPENTREENWKRLQKIIKEMA